MAKNSPPNPKLQSLRKHGSLNPNADRVVDPIFVGADFFDARDLVQVKYEMLRRVSVDGQPVSHSAAAFGFSRPSFYQAQTALKDGGLAALVPKRRGPRRSHKLSTEVMELVQRELSTDTSLNSSELALRIEARFGRKVHPRSVERAWRDRRKTVVIVSPPAIREESAAAYEELRNRVLSRCTSGGHVGLLLLLREGMAAWMARCCTRAVPSVAPDGCSFSRAAVARTLYRE